MSFQDGEGSAIERIVLTGFMGSGKTSVGRALAAQLGWTFEDLDDRVQAREGLSVPEIFGQRGEKAFRQAEAVALAELLELREAVIALGGGAPETAEVRALLGRSAQTAVVHLHAPFEVLYGRCKVQAEDPGATARPLLGDRDAAAARFARRKELYAAVATHTADAAAESPEAVAMFIVQELRAIRTRT